MAPSIVFYLPYKRKVEKLLGVVIVIVRPELAKSIIKLSAVYVAI